MNRIQLDDAAYQIVVVIGIDRARKYIWDTFKKQKFADLDNIDLEKFVRDHQHVASSVPDQGH